jgi:hypothetical protein
MSLNSNLTPINTHAIHPISGLTHQPTHRFPR